MLAKVLQFRPVRRIVTRRPPGPVDPTRRRHLLPEEVEALIRVAPWPDSAAILTCWVHGLRMQEFARLRWEQIDLARRVLHIWRLKHGLAADHPIPQREAANLLRLAEGMKPSELVFPAPRGGPWSEPAWTYRLRRAARAAGLEHLGVHPHMLRHACGYYLTNERGWDIHRVAAYLGHRKLEVTRGYAQLAPRQFAGAWEDV